MDSRFFLIDVVVVKMYSLGEYEGSCHGTELTHISFGALPLAVHSLILSQTSSD